MAIGKIPSTGSYGKPSGNLSHGAEKSAEEFKLEGQSTSADKAEKTEGAKLTKYRKSGKLTKLVDKKKRNRKGAPRTVLVDGEIFVVYLLAIA